MYLGENIVKNYFDDHAKTWDKNEIKSQAFFDNFVKFYVPIKPNMHVLDLGCGTGVISESIYKITKTDVLGLDLSPEMIKIANKKNKNNKISFLAQDFYQSELSNYDAIVCLNSYPYFIDKTGFKTKCYETLKPGGLLIICHTTHKDAVNTFNSKPGLIKSNKLFPAKKEAEFYYDTFDLLHITDDLNAYVIVLKKK